MGSEPSKKQAKDGMKPTHAKSTSVNNVKYTLLLHKSSPSQIKTVRNFRDALVQVANGEVKITKNINLANEDAMKDVRDLSWLEDLNNVVIICLSPEIVDTLAGVLRDKRFADENGHLHAKVLAVSFGKSTPAGWPPSGVSRPTVEKKDFCFGFEDGAVITPKEFEGATLNSLINTIMGAK